MSTTDAEQVTVTVTKHDTRIPGLGETRENWRAVAEDRDVAARGSTPARAFANMMAFVRNDEREALAEGLDSSRGEA